MAWAFERAGKGRGFAFTGCDLHQSWSEESQRKLVVNGILWSAGLEIPKPGAPVVFKAEDLPRNLDRKVAAPSASAAKPSPKAKAK